MSITFVEYITFSNHKQCKDEWILRHPEAMQCLFATVTNDFRVVDNYEQRSKINEINPFLDIEI